MTALPTADHRVAPDPTSLPATRSGNARRRTVRGRIGARLLRGMSAILQRLPEGLLNAMASLGGGVLYRTQVRRRRLVKANLERVVGYLSANNLGGDAVSRAARDGGALDRMVRRAFGHYVRGYLEGAALPAYAKKERLERVRPDEPALVERAFGATTSLIIVGLHFGAIEIPALWATKILGRRITAPMETIPDPDLQSYFVESRGRTGLNVIPVERAATELRSSLARGEAIALVADRPVGGSGTLVELFGVPARLPVGPAALALESGAPVWLVATRRVAKDEFRARLEELPLPADGTRRQRLTAFMTAEARAFERAIADAPEQWWTAFFQIWDDIAA
jgi:phosphatidylinositol dimannoside acyltransferase